MDPATSLGIFSHAMHRFGSPVECQSSATKNSTERMSPDGCSPAWSFLIDVVTSKMAQVSKDAKNNKSFQHGWWLQSYVWKNKGIARHTHLAKWIESFKKNPSALLPPLRQTQDRIFHLAGLPKFILFFVPRMAAKNRTSSLKSPKRSAGAAKVCCGLAAKWSCMHAQRKCNLHVNVYPPFVDG